MTDQPTENQIKRAVKAMYAARKALRPLRGNGAHNLRGAARNLRRDMNLYCQHLGTYKWRCSTATPPSDGDTVS